MIIRLLPTMNGSQPSQIVAFWETIKFACQKADMVKSSDCGPYFNELLHALLSDKAQCLIRLDENRVIIAIFITRIIGNKVTGKKHLEVQVSYSFQLGQSEAWVEEFQWLIGMAREMGCDRITFSTTNPHIVRIAEQVGAKKSAISFEYMVGGV